MATPDFLELVTRRERGKLKLYIGSAAGVGKTYRMLNEAHELKRRGVDVVVGFVETHGRSDTEAQIRDVEIVPRQRIQYRNAALEEMNLAAILQRNPQIAVVDELAHTNVPGVQHKKRWEDVISLLDAGINVIAAVNIQHLESLNDVIASTLGVTVRETIPDWVFSTADQVINLDISAEDLRERLQEGKIYKADKIDSAMRNFFTDENLTTLRELALREVASSVDRTREAIVRRELGNVERIQPRTVDRIMVAMSSNPPYTTALLRKASRIAGRLNSDWYCVYVRTERERADRIDTAVQRTLVENIQRAQAMGADVVKLEGNNVAATLCQFALEKGVTLLLVGQSRRSPWRRLIHGSVVEQLVNNDFGLDVLVATFDTKTGQRIRKPVKQYEPQTIQSRSTVEVGASHKPTRINETERHEYATMLAMVTECAAQRLNEIQLPLHILLENHFGDLNENQEEMLGAARVAADASDSDLKVLQEIAALDLGAKPARRDRIFPADLLRAMLPTLQAAAEHAGVLLRADIQALVPPIWADQAQLQKALNNLLRAAIAQNGNANVLHLELVHENSRTFVSLDGVLASPASIESALASRVVQLNGGALSFSTHRLTITLP